MSDDPAFVQGWLGRLAKADGIVAIQILETATGVVVLPPFQAAAEAQDEARLRGATLLRALTAPSTATDAEGEDAFAVVPPAWRGRLEAGEHAIYQARVGRTRVLEALVSRESQDVADLLDSTVEQLEAHFARPAE